MQKIRRFQPTLLPESKNLLPMSFLGLTIFVALQTLFILFLAARINHLAARKTTFVQLMNGSASVMTEEEGTYRTSDVIKNVARNWAMLTWNWESKLPGTPEPDKGYKVGRNRLTTTAYLASYLLQGKAKESETSSFREESRKAISELTPSGVFSGEVRSVLLIKYLSEPRTVAPGKYQVDMIATRTIISQQGEEEIPFNRTFTLEAVDIPKSPLGKNALEVEKAVYSLREAGLEISKLEPFTPSSQP